MAEYLNREEVVKRIEVTPLLQYGIPKEVRDGVIDLVKIQPAADVAPVVRGIFEPCFDDNGNWRQGFAKCSNCAKEYYAQVVNWYAYCPNCGAKMDGGADHEAD